MIPMEYMAPLMFAALVVVMLIGFPVAFSLGPWAWGLAFWQSNGVTSLKPS